MQDHLLLWILFAYGVVDLLGLTGFLPARIRRWIVRNKSGETLDVLRELGVNIDGMRRAAIAQGIPNASPKGPLAGWVAESLERFRLRRSVLVGSTHQVRSDSFIDLMGASADPANARLFANALAQRWREQVIAGEARQPDFDFVAASKRGSPLLAYEFAQRLHKPLLLHSAESKFATDENPELSASFDFATPPSPNARILIVDDSTTGGEKVMSIVSKLREFGYQVTDCLVVFEPNVKNAREILRDQGITLHSIVVS